MNRSPKNSHLTEEALIRAAVDGADLKPVEAGHLAGCEGCSRRLAELSGELDLLGSMARRAAPSTRPRPVRIEEQQGAWRWLTATRAAGAMAAVAVLAAAVVWLMPGPVDRPGVDVAAAPEIIDTAALIINVGLVDEDPLPGFHRFVLGPDPVQPALGAYDDLTTALES